jgi:hypothetical protein
VCFILFLFIPFLTYKQGIVSNGKVWQGKAATLNEIVIRGIYREVDTSPLLILNLRLGDIGEGADPAVMVHHYLQSWFPKGSGQVLEYIEIKFSFNPAKPALVAAHRRRMIGNIERILRCAKIAIFLEVHN